MGKCERLYEYNHEQFGKRATMYNVSQWFVRIQLGSSWGKLEQGLCTATLIKTRPILITKHAKAKHILMKFD